LPVKEKYTGFLIFCDAPIFRATLRPGAHILEKSAKGGIAMDPEYSHGDLDDLIYQEEWTASER
jgi:hypothetical protein